MSSVQFDILASAAQTATGQGGSIPVAGIKEMAVCVDVTSVSGSLSAIYLQTSSDGGTTWFDMLAAMKCVLTSGSGTTTTGGPQRNIMSDALTTGAVQKVWASFGGPSASFGNFVRAAWVISGSGPSCTFSVKGVGKN